MDTGRRSFLAVVLAWLASALALVWPRRALSAPLAPRGPFTPPTAPADPGPVTYHCKDPAFDEAVREMAVNRGYRSVRAKFSVAPGEAVSAWVPQSETVFVPSSPMIDQANQAVDAILARLAEDGLSADTSKEAEVLFTFAEPFAAWSERESWKVRFEDLVLRRGFMVNRALTLEAARDAGESAALGRTAAGLEEVKGALRSVEILVWAVPAAEYRQAHRVYKDAGRMLDEMFDHLCETGHSVLCADDPERARFGFVTFDATPGAPEARVTWQAGMTGVKKLLADMEAGRMPASFSNSSPRAAAILRECLQSSEGRLRFAMAYEAAGRARFQLRPLT